MAFTLNYAQNGQKRQIKKTYLTDSRDGKTYKTVKIGNQLWMAENLAYDAGNGAMAFNMDSVNINEYGYLYSYQIAVHVCPEGWHLPSMNEFEELYQNMGKTKEQKYENILEGGQSGFNVRFSGIYSFGIFTNMEKLTIFWSSKTDDNFGYSLLVYKETREVKLGRNVKNGAFSVRCIKD